MKRPATSKLWNTDLIAACEARLQDAIARQMSTEFAWRNAKQLIEASTKEIWLTSTNSIAAATRTLVFPPAESAFDRPDFASCRDRGRQPPQDLAESRRG